MYKMQKLSLTLMFCLLLGATLGACGSSSTSNNGSTANHAPTKTPGVGVAVTGGRWQVTLTNPHTTDNWAESRPSSGFIFLVVDLTFHNLDSSQTTKVSVMDVNVVSQNAGTFTPTGFQYSSASNTYEGDPYTLLSTGNTLSATFVFVIKTSLVGQTLKLRFQQVPLIPFIVK